MEALLEEFQKAKDHGRSESQLIEMLHQRGLTITESIKAFMQIYQVPLRDAKERVAANPCWREIVQAAQPLHDQAENAFHNGERHSSSRDS